VALGIGIRRDFLFCQKRKPPPAGKALTPQPTIEATKPKEQKAQRTENAKIKSEPLTITFLS
ncbi:MAG: hypothetical protein ABI642_10650, partial [Polaromonas sp.]